MDGIVKCVAVAVLLLAVVGVAACGDDEPAQPAVEAEGGIYRAALLTVRDGWAATGGDDATVVLQRTNDVEPQTFDASVVPSDFFPSDGKLTWADRIRDQVLGSFPALRRDNWNSYAAANAEPWDLSQVVRVPWRTVFIDQGEMDELFQGKVVDEGFRTLFKRYPGAEALLTMSMPGVSEDGAQALLYLTTSSGELSASGYYLLLLREGDSWRVAQRKRVWIS